MEEYIKKTDVLAEIKRRYKFHKERNRMEDSAIQDVLYGILNFINSLEIIDPYEQCIQYPNIKDGIQAQAEIYSFNIESELFNQLTKGEQQELWRKEIEQAYMIGGETGVELARDTRYKENVEMKEVDLDKEIQNVLPSKYCWFGDGVSVYFKEQMRNFAKHFFELGLKAKG